MNYQCIVPIEQNEHIFLSYGEFSNRELFLFYGYIEDNNELDAFEISLALPEDELVSSRIQLLEQYNLKLDQHYLRIGPLAETLKAALRITTCSEYELETLKKTPLAYGMISEENEIFIYQTLQLIVNSILSNFDSSLKDDLEFLDETTNEEIEGDEDWPQRKLCIRYRILMKQILSHALDEIEICTHQLHHQKPKEEK